MKAHPVNLLRRLAGLGLLLALLAVAWMGAAAFVAHAPSFYGTARAPHSDALSWLFGALGFYFYGESHNVLLLRPTIGVMFSSIFTLSGSIAAIPKVFAGLYAAALLAAFALAELRGRLALLALAGLAWLAQRELMQPLSPDSLNTDFPSFAFTFAGLLLVMGVLAGRQTKAAGVSVLTAGYLLLGFAAAIRGPMLLAGPVLLLLTLVWSLLSERGLEQFGKPRSGPWWWRAVRTTALAAVAFVLPVVGDSLLRAGLGLDAPGLIAFYSFYADPTHTLTNDAYFRYVELKPSTLEVVRDYLAFILSAEGRQVVVGSLLERLTIDGNILIAIRFPYVLAGAFLVDAGLRVAAWRSAGPGALRPVATAVTLGMVLIALAGMFGELGSAGVVLGLVGVSLAWPLLTGRLVPAAFALAYVSGLIFVVLTGTKDYGRIAHTFVFALYAAPLWVVLDPAPVLWERTRRTAAAGIAGLAVVVVLVLTTANALVPTPMKAVYRAEVMGRSAAIKIAEDRRLDRSLYFSGHREMLYTRRDGEPVGTVRRYRAFDNPNGPIGVPEEIEGLRAHNALFNNPGAFVE